MPSLKDIRAKIDTTKNTQQITRAMKMVSAAALRRAQQNIVNLRPYANTILQVIADIAATQRVAHPLLTRTENPTKVLLVDAASGDQNAAGPSVNCASGEHQSKKSSGYRHFCQMR